MRNMLILGVDTAKTITKDAAETLHEEGYSFVGRYLSKTTGVNAAKVIKADEARRIRDAGLAILLIWETSAARAKGGAAAGVTDGAAAKDLAKKCGVPETTTIYFAVDYNAPTGDFAELSEYLKAARAAVAPYNAGVYGPRHVIDAMHDMNAVHYFMQCVAWSSGVSDHADIYQYEWQKGKDALALAEKINTPVDLCKAYDCRAAGMWLPTYNEYDDGEGGTVMEPTQNNSAQKKPWYAEDQAWCEEKKIINDGRGNENLTRGEMMAITHRLYNTIFEDMRRESGLLTDD